MFDAHRIWITGAVAIVLAGTSLRADPPPAKSLPRQTEELFLQAFGDHPGSRLVHSKGIVFHGTFEPAKAAAELSKAAHFKSTVPVIIRFSDGTGLPQIPDGNPNPNPKGMALRFQLSGGDTDITKPCSALIQLPVVSTPCDCTFFGGASRVRKYQWVAPT